MELTSNELAILSELEKSPTHGYELATIIGVRVTSIYNTLNSLMKKGLIDGQWKERQKVYSITSEGIKKLSIDRGFFAKKWGFA